MSILSHQKVCSLNKLLTSKFIMLLENIYFEMLIQSHGLESKRYKRVDGKNVARGHLIRDLK